MLRGVRLLSATATHPRHASRPASILRAKLDLLLSPDHFEVKLLLGTAVGVLVIIVLANTCFVVTFQSQRQARLRAHTIGVMRLRAA